MREELTMMYMAVSIGIWLEQRLPTVQEAVCNVSLSQP